MLRFAPRYGIISPALVRPSRLAPRHGINDNRSDHAADPAQTVAATAAIADARVEAALRLFAAHGFAAPDQAQRAAANANARGDDRDARWWAAVGAVFGRRRP